MGKILFLFCFIFVSSISAVELEGNWKVTIAKSENKYCLGSNQISFVSSPFNTPSGQPLFMVKGTICKRNIWGASIENLENKQHLVWYDQDNNVFDSESNIILSSSRNELSLGGDFEEYEVGTMIKLD